MIVYDLLRYAIVFMLFGLALALDINGVIDDPKLLAGGMAACIAIIYISETRGN